MYYRYEIVVNEKNYGLITGLSEIGLDKDYIDELTEELDKYLPIPDFYYLKGENAKKDVYAYFTEKGVERFKNCIEDIIHTVKLMDCKVIIKEQSEVGTRRLIYKDKYQALIKSK